MGTTTRITINLFIVLLAVLGGFYQIYLKPFFFTAGIHPARTIHSLGNGHCKGIPELQACEEIVLHEPTGVVYLACSTPFSRTHWIPAMGQFNTTGASTQDYVATYDPATSRVTRLTTSDFNGGRGLSSHGLDVVSSQHDPNVLFIYMVNHRIPLGDVSPAEVGADSVIEIFSTSVGSTTMRHLKTIEDPIIITPNSVLGLANGKGFYFTNDHGARVGWRRVLDDWLSRRTSSVGYCHIDEGCKYALTGVHSSNGITWAPNGTIYVTNSRAGSVEIFERQADNTLVETGSIKTDYFLDNIAMDSNGQLWVAAIPLLLKAAKHMKNPSLPSPSIALRLSINTGPNSFYGEKYRVEKVFEDDGAIMSGITSVAYDSQGGKLFMCGISSPQFVVCDIE